MLALFVAVLYYVIQLVENNIIVPKIMQKVVVKRQEKLLKKPKRTPSSFMKILAWPVKMLLGSEIIPN
jgi:hypothetical protein